MQAKTDAIVIGAGIAGLGMAYHLARSGREVVVFERNQRAIEASIRNFGLVWPIGQPEGELLELALTGRAHWQELAKKAGFWHSENGSLHLAHHPDEWEVLEEFMASTSKDARPCELLTADQVINKSPAVKRDGLIGGLWSKTEMTVNPREAMAKIAAYLEEQWNVTFYFHTNASQVDYPVVHTTRGMISAEEVYICSGVDFETLYPNRFRESGLQKVKLQMMRTDAQPDEWRIGPSLCAGLTLQHYQAFAHCQSLPALKARFARELPDYLKWGIHVLLSQNGLGHLIIGDSHEYGITHDPFESEAINQMILDYLQTFVHAPSLKITERWHGIYSKSTTSTYFLEKPEEGVTLFTGLGGAGMTLSLGLTEKIANDSILSPLP